MLMASALMAMLPCAANSPYISKVYDYVPAPGQFVNTMPEIEPGCTREQVLEKVLEQIGHDRQPGMISLGAYGGYVVFGFDHPVANVAGACDFKIYGNAFKSDSQSTGGNSEPGIVMVSADANGNGVPDDEWYELAGSDYAKETTLKHYKITYYKTPADHVAVPDPAMKQVVDTQYIRWTASDGTEGYVTRNTYHQQPYWPYWIEADRLEFEGTRLAPNGRDVSGTGAYYVLSMLDWGYADNRANNDPDYHGFDISNAVDAQGRPVKLAGIDFVKVYTGINQTNGWVGENSTEVAGAEDLHPDVVPGSGIRGIDADPAAAEAPMYDLYGRRIASPARGTIYISGGRKHVAR